MSSTTLVLVLSLTSTGIAPPKRSLKKFHDTRACSSPRKSLVKGERFIRSEEKPEYTGEGQHTLLEELLPLTQ